MTPGGSLREWESSGSMNRELMPYQEYVRQGWKVKVLTFDKGRVPDSPEDIGIVRFPSRRFLCFLPWMCKDLGRWADIIKTNQSAHAYFYTWAANLW